MTPLLPAKIECQIIAQFWKNRQIKKSYRYQAVPETYFHTILTHKIKKHS